MKSLESSRKRLVRAVGLGCVVLGSSAPLCGSAQSRGSMAPEAVADGTSLYPASAGSAGSAPTQQHFAGHGGSQEESHGHYIMTCSDGGYLQIGETGFLPKSAKVLVVRANADGSLVWKREFGVAGHNLGNSAIELSDGYLIAGALDRNGTLIKLNKANGDTLFCRSIDNGGTDAIEHLAELPDGSVVGVGYTDAQDSNHTFYTEGQGLLVYYDSEGYQTSSQSLNRYLSHAYRVQLSGSTLVVSGLTSEALDYAVLKLDLDGGIVWNKIYGGNESDHCFGLDLGSDGSVFLTGHTLSGTQNWDTYIMKLDSDGNQLWEVKVGNPRGYNSKYIHDESWGIKATSDGGCVIVAGTGDEYRRYSDCSKGICSDQWEVYLVKMSAAGEVEWQATYSGKRGVDWAGEDIDLTPDGGAIIAVDNGSFGFLKVSPF